MSTVQEVERSVVRPNAKALAYKNDHVIDRLVGEYELGREEANVLFADTLKFLALTEGGIKLSPPARIDLGWHNFILHTREYAEFCQSCFGHFIHHEPGSGLIGTGPRLNVEETVALAREAFGALSSNWDNRRGPTCGSNGC